MNMYTWPCLPSPLTLSLRTQALARQLHSTRQRNQCVVCCELHTAATYTEARCAADILLCEDVTVVYKAVGDLIFFVTGASAENEIILFTVLSTLTDALDNLLRCGASRFWTSSCVCVLDAVQ